MANPEAAIGNVREFDIIVWGASGFTGRLVAGYLYRQYRHDDNLKWAMAGRNIEKLKSVREQVADSSVPLIAADSHDPRSLDDMARRCTVLLTTVGPYGQYGAGLVAACVQHRTHYCDLAGEVPWMRQMIDRHHEAAQQSGSKIVHACGFDSVPSDLGVYYTQKMAVEQSGQPAHTIQMRVKAFKGQMSGGTYASLSDAMEKASRDRRQLNTLIEPYSLNPSGLQQGPDRADLRRVVYDDVSRSWIYPFIMAAINSRVVRRSHALGNYPYGREFRYDEAVLSGGGVAGRIKGLMAAGVLGLMLMAKPGSLWKRVVDHFLPEPGEGPDAAAREAGFYNLRFYATLHDGRVAMAKVTGDRDPGYGSTSKIIAECGVCLARDATPDVAGVLTPSIAMGDALLHRLQQNAGLTFSYQPSP